MLEFWAALVFIGLMLLITIPAGVGLAEALSDTTETGLSKKEVKKIRKKVMNKMLAVVLSFLAFALVGFTLATIFSR